MVNNKELSPKESMNNLSMGSLSIDTKEKFIGLIKHLNMNRPCPTNKSNEKVNLLSLEQYKHEKIVKNVIDSSISQTSFFEVSPSTTSIDSSQIQSIASNSSLILHDSNSSLANKNSNGIYNLAFLDDCNYDLNISHSNNNESQKYQLNQNTNNNNNQKYFDENQLLTTITSSFQPSYEKLNSSELGDLEKLLNKDAQRTIPLTKTPPTNQKVSNESGSIEQQKIFSYKNTQTEEKHFTKNETISLDSSCQEDESEDDDLLLLLGINSLSNFETDQTILCSKHKKFKLLLNNYNILKINQMRDKSDKSKEEKVLKRRQSLFLLKQKRALESLNNNAVSRKNHQINERLKNTSSLGHVLKRLNCFQILN